MIELYESLLARLQSEVPGIKWIDEDNGQLDVAERPAVAWPCCLIDIAFPNCENTTGTEQQSNTQVTLRLAWDFLKPTASNVPEAVRTEGLSPYVLIDAVHVALQGWVPNGCVEPLSRKSQKKATTRAAFEYNMVYGTVREG